MANTTQVEQQFISVLDHLAEDLRTLRPGRASFELIATLPVEAYSSRQPLQQLAAISSDEQGNLLVRPWDKANMGAIEKAISVSQLGFSLTNQGDTLRLAVPPLSQQRRQELVKLVGQKAEEARVRLRQARVEALQRATKDKNAGALREDELVRLTKELNELIDSYNKKIKELSESKEKELLSV